MGSAPGDTTTRKYGKQHCGTNLKTKTSPLFTCITFQPNYKKSPQGNQTRFPEDVAGPHQKAHKETPLKSRNATMGHLHTRRQRLKSTKETPTDTDLEDKMKKNVVLCATVEPITTKEGKIY